ncbi:MAG: prepilin-type N-terminal cleavage/methylation domain-containing protein, partial [Methylophilaceae bacterium]|nr:prepilin-type N-terminal cleavage/methylation domain-containing protein [Methylophilaceae bacterium]
MTKQKGFTLLELLVVIVLLAVLSVGALVAYEGIGENASNVAAANNIKTADSSIRAFRAIENVYPNQWDNLANLGGELTGGAFSALADATKGFLTQVEFDETVAAAQAAMVSLGSVGITELQTLTTAAEINLALNSPNEAFNESAPGVSVPADEVEWELNDDGTFDTVNEANFFMSAVPSSTGVACTFAGSDLTTNLAGDTVVDSKILNRINDALDDDGCHLVVALGFGKDVPGTTLGSRVAISTAPTYTNGNVINPSIHYARYIALFYLGSADEDGATPTEVTAADIL